MTTNDLSLRAGNSLREGLLRLLRGAGQVMFQQNLWCGLLFLCGIFAGAYHEGRMAVAWGALTGLFVSTFTGWLLGLSEKEGRQGLWGFNGILVGCAFPTFLGMTPAMWCALVLCSALTVWVREGFNRVMASWRVNSLTFPFVFSTWIFLLAAHGLHALPPTYLSTPELPVTFSSEVSMHGVAWLLYGLRGVSQVFLLDSWITGAFFLVGLLIACPWAALWAAVGSILSLLLALVMQASGVLVTEGLYGFSGVLTAIALATVFYRPGWRSALWALLGIVVTFFVQVAMDVAVAPLGIVTLTAPFCITTWLFLLPMIRLDEEPKPDHSNWSPENKHHLR